MAATKLAVPPRGSQLPRASSTKRQIRASPITKTSTATTKSKTTTPSSSAASTTRKQPTPYQRLVYAHLLCIPAGRVTTYQALSNAIATAKDNNNTTNNTTTTTTNRQEPPPVKKTSSPRAIGGALRVNPFAPQVPCHRVIASSGFVGGFKGDWEDAPSGVNQVEKLGLLGAEGVEFDAAGRLLDLDLGNGKKAKLGKGGDGGGRGVWFSGPWPFEEHVKEVEGLCRGLES